MKKHVQFLSPFLALALLAGCGGSEKNPSENAKDSTAVVATDSIKDLVLYNIPSPIETFTILKMYGPGFDKSLTSPAANISKHSSDFLKAVNLGVYSTDLSFCFLYKQNQEFNTYLKNVNELTTALGIDGSYGQSITKRLPDNSNNMDSLMVIVSEASINANIYLKENQRVNTTALIAAGSWIEAMHIITNIANKKQDEAITGLVADQKVAIKNLSKMLEQFESNAETAELLAGIRDIGSVYDGLQPVQGNTLVSEDKLVKSIGNNTSYTLSAEQLKSILDKVDALRTKLTN